MRKEVLLAVIFGIILGGIILFGINLANKSVVNNDQIKTTNKDIKITPTPSKTTKNFEISFPQNHSVVTEKTIVLSGNAFPGSTLAVVSESDDLILEASPEGSFSAQINLIGGENTISVTNLLKDNRTETQSITVIQTNTLPE